MMRTPIRSRFLSGLVVGARLAFAALLLLATVAAARPGNELPARPERSCCTTMMPEPGHCPAQPPQGTSGSCCGTPLCFHLFLQTGEIRLAPGCTDVRWESVAVHAVLRSERPPVPPPRA